MIKIDVHTIVVTGSEPGDIGGVFSDVTYNRVLKKLLKEYVEVYWDEYMNEEFPTEIKTTEGRYETVRRFFASALDELDWDHFIDDIIIEGDLT